MKYLLPLDSIQFEQTEENIRSFNNLKRDDSYKEKLFVTKISGLIEWKENPENWCGPYLDKYVYCTIIDHSYDCDLKTLESVMLDWKNYKKYSTYSFPKRVIELIKFNGNMEYTDGDGNKKSCFRSSLTHEEYTSAVNNLTKEETNEYNKNVRKPHLEPKAILCKECPIMIRLSGNDDISYSTTVSNMNVAKRTLDEIVLNQKWWKAIDTLFSFTN